MTEKKVAILYPSFLAGGMGGGESVAVWMIEALKKDYEVCLVTYSTITADKLNKFYGTRLSPSDFSVINPPLFFLFKGIRGLGLLKYHLLMRFFKPSSGKFDFIIGAYKEMDFKQKGAQYIHFPDLTEAEMGIDSKKLGLLYGLYHGHYFFRKLYKFFCYAISGSEEEDIKKNITLTNSNWTKDIIKKKLGVGAQVVYPPVPDDFIVAPWEQRENGFICLSRISPVKQIKFIIEVLDAVRGLGFNVHLHIIGPIGDNNYYKEIKQMQKERTWLFIEGIMPRENLALMIPRHKYGINGRKEEHFGISVAEMAKAGCIVFVPNGGGQVEIVNNRNLTYEDKNDAVKKITKILRDTGMQIQTQKELRNQARKFSVENFKTSIQKIAKDFLDNKLIVEKNAGK